MMEKLILHIENLLITKDFVIVPGLGGFVMHYESACISPDCITPPLYSIGFNPDMRSNDGLLALELLKAEKISYKEANLLIEKKVKKLISELQHSKDINVGRLGTLSLDKNKYITFKASPDLTFLPSNFGLQEVYISEREKTDETVTVTIRKNNIFRYAAALLILLGIFIISPDLGESGQVDYAGFDFRPKQIPTVPIEEIMKDETEFTANDEISVSSPCIKIKDYHIVVGCFSNFTQAEKYRETLLKKQFANAYILPSAKINRVIINSFSGYDEAVEYLRDIRHSDYAFKDAWLYKHSVEF